MSDSAFDMDERFRGFMDAQPWTESIDELELTAEQSAASKADYFVDDRQVVVEVKSVQKDMGPDLQRALEPFTQQEDWPVFYGPSNVAPFLRRHPRRDEIMPVLLRAVTKGVDNQIKKANQQIRSTGETFGLADSAGLVVYLNDQSEAIAPDVLVHRIARLFNSHHDDGRARYSSIQAVLVLSATHVIRVDGAPPAFPCILVTRVGLPEDHAVLRAGDRVIREWAQHNGSVLLTSSFEELDELSNGQQLVSELMKPSPSGPKPRYQHWIQEYHENPFLRPLTDDALVKLGAEVMARFMAAFLKGSRYKPARTELQAHIRVFTATLEELKFRGIGVDQIPRRHRDYYTKLMSDLSGVQPSSRGGG